MKQDDPQRQTGAAVAGRTASRPTDRDSGAAGGTTNQYLSLTDAAKIAPGRPSANCLWRWCRRGVRARDGERVHLQHIRLGGTLYTTAEWLDAFGRTLADADAHHFERSYKDVGRVDDSAPRNHRRRQEIERAEAELDRAGLR